MHLIHFREMIQSYSIYLLDALQKKNFNKLKNETRSKEWKRDKEITNFELFRAEDDMAS